MRACFANWEQFRAFVEALGQTKDRQLLLDLGVVATRSRRICPRAIPRRLPALSVEPMRSSLPNPHVTDGVRSLRRIAEQKSVAIERIKRSTNRDAT